MRAMTSQKVIPPWTVRAWNGTKLIDAAEYSIASDKDASVSEWKQWIRRGEVTRIEILDHRKAEKRTVFF